MRRSLISGNILVDNGGSIFLWQSSNRFCSDGADGICTLVDGGRRGRFTISGCRSHLTSASISMSTYAGRATGSPPRDWWDGCLWRTENVSITHNVIDFSPARITDCNQADWPACGAGGIFSEYGSVAPYDSAVIPTQLTFHQNNSWSDNQYNGPSSFYAWNQGNGDNPVSWADWTGKASAGDRCASEGERSSGYCRGPFGQDAGSTYRAKPAGSPLLSASGRRYGPVPRAERPAAVARGGLATPGALRAGELGRRRFSCRLRRVIAGTSKDAASMSSRRYVVASVNPSSVNDATRQYVRRKSASARWTPRGLK